MRFLEIRRHSLLDETSEHLSPEGIVLAQQIGQSRRPFDRVITSPDARAQETAEAMGCTLDGTMDGLAAELPPDLLTEIDYPARDDWSSAFAIFADAAHGRGATAAAGQAQVQLWRSILARVPEGGRALVISHRALIMAGAVIALPDADHTTWGGPLGMCEGLRFGFSSWEFTSATLLRVNAGIKGVN